MDFVAPILTVIGGFWVVYQLAKLADEYFASKRLEKQRARYRELVKKYGEYSPDSPDWQFLTRDPGSL